MKAYEACADLRLAPRLPMIVRLDGRAFHAWTRKTGCQKPFDTRLIALMAQTARHLCENCTDCILAYTQSDEISLLFRDPPAPKSTSWFDRRLQKLTSLTASIATFYFNAHSPFPTRHPAYFDSRAFVLPESEVRPYFIWRQADASKNSLSMLAQSLYPQHALQNRRRADLHELCHQKGVNWNDLPAAHKRGIAVYKTRYAVAGSQGPALRRRFFIDEEIPLFTASDCTLFNP